MDEAVTVSPYSNTVKDTPNTVKDTRTMLEMESDVKIWVIVLMQLCLLVGGSLCADWTSVSGVLVSSALAQSSDAKSFKQKTKSFKQKTKSFKQKTKSFKQKTKSSKQKKRVGPVVFEPKSKRAVLLAPRQKTVQRKSSWSGSKDVVILPFSLSKFKNASQMMSALQKHIPGARRKELVRMIWQMMADSDAIPPQLGGVFVPNIIDRANVTPVSYTLYDKYNRPVAITATGKKSFVHPGVYTVRVGRRGNDLLPTFKVRVLLGQMTIIRPRWAVLIIRVVDERLIQFRGTYDLIHLAKRTSIGTGIGADGELGEKVRPWLVPAGTYMIVRVGDNYLARTNYFTVQVNPGRVTRFRLVINKNTNQFLGGGVLVRKPKSIGDSGWRWSLQLNGNILLNYTNNVGSSSNGFGFSMAAFFFGRVLYNKNQHFFSSTLNAELGFTLPSQGIFQKGSDRLELQAIYVYRVLPWLGPYIRADFETVMLPSWWNFPGEDQFTKQDVSIFTCVSVACQLRETVAVTSGQQLQQLQLSTIFDPVLLKQGLGVNIQPLNSTWINLRILFGLGFRQEITREVFQFDPKSDVYTTRCKNQSPTKPNPVDQSGCKDPADQEKHTSVLLYPKATTHREGLEIAMVATGQLSRFISYTFELDALAPFEFSKQATFISFNNFEFDGRLTVILRLSHYASFNLRLRIRRNPTLAKDSDAPESERWSIDLSNALSFSLLF